MGLGVSVQGIDHRYGNEWVLRNVTLPRLRGGELVAVIGSNGAGKSTLLRSIAGIGRQHGSVLMEIDGKKSNVKRITNRILYVPQELPPQAAITVFEAVLLSQREQRSGQIKTKVIEEAEKALQLVGMLHLGDRLLSQLSGGQRQLVSLAQAMVRRPEVLLLDEPTNNLDLKNQIGVLELVRRFASERKAICCVVLHDLTLASRFADRLLILHRGGLYSSGTPGDVITSKMLWEVYGAHGYIHRAPDGSLIPMISGRD